MAKPQTFNLSDSGFESRAAYMPGKRSYYFAKVICKNCGKEFEVGRFKAGVINDKCPHCKHEMKISLNMVRKEN